MASQRRTVLYSGHVQGVGFRHAVRQLAGKFDVRGYVRNLPDGRVELVAEGEPAEVDRLLAAVAQRMEGHIAAAEQSTGPAAGTFAGFEVRR